MDSMIITQKFYESTMKGAGWRYRYKKGKSSGDFHVSMLFEIEKTNTIDWKSSFMRVVDDRPMNYGM